MAITIDDKQKELETAALEPIATNSATEPVNTNPSDMISTTWPNTDPAETMTDTGFFDTDGTPIKSAYGNADSFFSQISRNNIIDNTPSGAMSYQGYLAYNNITDPRIQYQQNLDAAKQQYATALGTYGSAGEALAQNGLVGSGYSDYLNGVAYAQQVGNQVQAQQLMAQQQAQYGQAYNNYVNDYNNGLVDRNGNAVTNTSATGEQQLGGAYSAIASSNPATAAEYSAIKQSLLAQGYDESTIDEAYANWQKVTSESDVEETTNAIGNISSLSIGNAESLKTKYGSGEKYDNAMMQLQEQNDNLVNKLVDLIVNNDLENLDFDEITTAIRENTANTDSDGVTSYSWDTMGDGDKVRNIVSYLTEMKYRNEISAENYDKAISSIAMKSIEIDKDTKGGVFSRAGTKRVTKLAEDMANVEYNTRVSEETKSELYKAAGSYIDSLSVYFVPSENTRYIKISINGKSTSLYIDGVTNGKTTKTDKPRYSVYEENGTLYVVSGDGYAYKFNKFNGLTEAQSYALVKMINAKDK